MSYSVWLSLRKKCPYSGLFWSLFSCIRIEYGEIRSIANPCETTNRHMKKKMLNVKRQMMKLKVENLIFPIKTL